MTKARVSLRSVLVGVGAATILLVLIAVPSSASAATRDILFSDTAQSARYGESWGTDITMTGLGCFTYCGGGTATFSYSGPRSGSGALSVSGSKENGVASSFLSSYALDNGSTVLTPGKYVFSLYFSSYADAVSGSNTFTLTITPAPIGTDLRVVSDPANPRNAVVSLALTGDYATSIGGEAGGPPLPAGTWHLSVQDADKKTVFSKDIEQITGGSPFITQYWTGVESGPYTASGSFEIESAVANRFTATNADGVKFAPDESSSTASPDPTSSAVPVSAATTSGGPLWALALEGLATLGLIIGLVIATLRRRRVTRQASDVTPSVAAPAFAGGGPDARR